MNVSVREALSAADKAISLDIYNAVEVDEPVTAAEVARWAALADATTDLIATLDGEDVGSGVCSIDAGDVASVFIDVLPNARRRGAGSALLGACAAFALTHGKETLQTRVHSDDEESLAFAHNRGFVEHGRDDWLELDVAAAANTSPPPPGIVVVPLVDRPELADAAYDVACESLPDIPGEDDWIAPPRATWVEQFVDVHGATALLAVAEGEVVGFALLRPRGAFAVHGMTAVKRAWRGRGIARALKSVQIDWARMNGIAQLRTANEQRNAPMRNLNLSLGYVPVRDRITLRGPAAQQVSAAGSSDR